MTAMGAKRKSRIWVIVVATVVCLALPTAAVAKRSDIDADAVLYEVTENMYFYDAQGKVIPPDLILTGQAQPASRVADATLQGWAELGNPLCPSTLLITNSRAQTCTVTAMGQDNINLTTGQGTVSGSYAVVLNIDNPTDAAEYVVQTGTFSGQMDLSARPLGTITGTFTPVGTTLQIPFRGTFRLPFNVDGKGKREDPKRGRKAYYLADDGRTLIHVQSSELSLDLPLVRLELYF